MANPVTHLEKAIAGEVSPVTHLEQVIAEYGGGNVYENLEEGTNILIEETSDGKARISASGEVSSEDTVARADIAAIKDGETLDSFGDVESALDDKADSTTTYTKTEIDTALSAKANSADVYTKTAVDTALGNKADKSTTYTKTEVDTALSDKVDKETGKGLSTNDYTATEKTKLAGIEEGAEVNEIEGIKVNSSTVNPDANKVVNITVPTTAADVSALPDTTKYAAALSLTINSSTYVMTGQLKDQNGDNLGTAQTIDLPLESVVVGGSYNSQTKKVVLTLQNGNTIEFSVADLVSGLQTELSASNKLNPAYINYDSTHRAVSDTEKSTWNGKQSALTSAQLAAVNSGIDSTKVTQIETNKNNILYSDRNKMPYTLSLLKTYNTSGTWNGNAYTVNNLTFTINNDMSITVTASGAITLTDFKLGVVADIPLEPDVVYWGYGGLPTSDYNYWGFKGGAGISNKGLNAGSIIPDTLSNYTDVIIRISSALGAASLTFKPMIVKKSIYDSGVTDYIPYNNAELYEMILNLNQ